MTNPEFDFSPDFYPHERLFYEDLLNVADIEQTQLEMLHEDLDRLKTEANTSRTIQDRANVILLIAATQGQSYAEVKRLAESSGMDIRPDVALTFYETMPEIRIIETALKNNDMDNASHISIPADRTEEDYMEALLLAARATGYSLSGIVNGMITVACPWMSLEEVKEQHSHDESSPQSSNGPW